MAAVDRPPFPINVLHRIVCVGNLVDNQGDEWWEIPCASKKAYGCREKMQEAVEGLKLYARLGDGPLLASSLSVRMTADARRRFESELGIDPDGPYGSDLRANAVVETAEQEGVTAIALFFRRSSLRIRRQRTLSYVLVYDATNRSLSMFQIPRGEGVLTWKLIVPKRTDDCKLFLLGRDLDFRSSSSHKDDVSFWVGSLSSSDGTAVPSRLKSMVFPTSEMRKPFNVDVAFSFQGKGFWGDLRQGLVYCDLQTSGDSDMDFGFVKLPCECKVDEETVEPHVPMRRTRTLGCAGDSIWFVCIDTPSHYSNAVVCIWELVFPGGQLKWKRAEVGWNRFDTVPAKELLELDSFKESGLPAALMLIKYPILTADGALCLVLVDQSRFLRNEHPLLDHFCSFDMHGKRLLWHGLVHSYSVADSIVMYPSNFLQMKESLCNMSSAEDRHDAGHKDLVTDSIVRYSITSWLLKCFGELFGDACGATI